MSEARNPPAALRDAVWPELVDGPGELLICPLGALEQHGPHLPLDTDTALAVRVAARLHRRRPGSALAPAIPFGASGEHAGFPGTLSIGSQALSQLVVELVRDASRQWSGVLLVNGHGGNLAGLQEAQRICRYEARRLGVNHLALPGMDAHAGHSETSLMLYLEPDRVRMAAASVGRTEPIGELLPELRSRGVRPVSPNGVLGDPTTATAAAGELLFGRLVDRAVADYDALLG